MSVELRRWRTRARADGEAARLARLGEVCAVLDDARAIIGHGWLQDDWYVQTGGPGDARACVVGAVVQATRRHDPAAGLLEAGPALDVLWDALQEARGFGGPGVAGRAAPAELRAARIRDLTRWNDRPGRTHEEVLNLVDLAVSHAVMAAMRPSPARR
jgi:hypothetical protein